MAVDRPLDLSSATGGLTFVARQAGIAQASSATPISSETDDRGIAGDLARLDADEEAGDEIRRGPRQGETNDHANPTSRMPSKIRGEGERCSNW